MMTTLRLLMCAALTVSVFTGCRSAPIKVNDFKEGHWNAKALIKDKDKSRSYIVHLNFNAIKNERARMDVTSTLGTGVASLVVLPNEVRYVLLDSKRFYYGVPQPNVMKPILALPFDPRWIYDLLFEEPILDKGWVCRRDKDGWLEECTQASTSTVVTWSNRRGERKTILIEHPKASVQINVTSFKPKVEDRKNLFKLEAPEGYQKLRVR